MVIASPQDWLYNRAHWIPELHYLVGIRYGKMDATIQIEQPDDSAFHQQTAHILFPCSPQPAPLDSRAERCLSFLNWIIPFFPAPILHSVLLCLLLFSVRRFVGLAGNYFE